MKPRLSARILTLISMDSDFLIWDIDYVGANGVTLTFEERSGIQNAMTILKADGKFKKVYFWGKILGVSNDYYVAEGVGRDILRQRQTFYSTDGRRWVLLTPPEQTHVELSKYVRKQYSGDPTTEVEIKIPYIRDYEIEEELQFEEYEEEMDEMEGDDEAQVARAKRRAAEKEIEKLQADQHLTEEEGEAPTMTEEERLACSVHVISQEAVIAPRAAYIRTPSGEVLPNQFFRGLDEIEAGMPENYVHIRFPLRSITQRRLRSSEMERAIDFFDVISEDMPKGCWSLQLDSSRGLAITRSLWWPGMVFYHVPGTRSFGNMYIGTGLKNIDLPFML